MSVNYRATPAVFSIYKPIFAVEKNAMRSAFNIISTIKQFSNKVFDFM